jgi:hypothetical protein
MDISHGDRRRRSLLRRTIGCLLLVILWPLNAAGFEGTQIQRLIVRDNPAYVSSAKISKNIIVGYTSEEEAVFAAEYLGYRISGGALINFQCKSGLLWPYCRCCRERVRGAEVDPDRATAGAAL